MNVLMFMWNQPERGTASFTIETLSRMGNCSIEEAEKAVEELCNTGVCDTDLPKPVQFREQNGTKREQKGIFILKNRRMIRDEKVRKKERRRKRESRDYANVRKVSGTIPAIVRDLSGEFPPEKTEDRSKKTEDRRDNDSINTPSTSPTFEQVTQYLQSAETAHNISNGTEGLTAETYPGYLEKFLRLQRRAGKKWTSLQDAYNHFCNWLDKQNIKTVVKEKIVIR